MPEEDRPRAGRQRKPLSEDEPELKAFVEWLRKLVGPSATARSMAEEFPYGRSRWNDYLSGSKLIPPYLLKKVVEARARPNLREAALSEGHEKLEAAERAAQRRLIRQAPPTQRAPAGEDLTAWVSRLQLQLDDARKAQMDAERTVMGFSRLVFVLLTMFISTKAECTQLKHERDQAISQKKDSVHRLTREVEAFTELLADTKERLARAEEDTDQAEELRITAQRRAEEYRLALEESTKNSRQRPDDPGPERAASTDPLLPEVSNRPALWEYKQRLEAADDQLDAQEAQMAALRERMDITPPTPAPGRPTIIVGEVVRTPAADNVDNHFEQANPPPDLTVSDPAPPERDVARARRTRTAVATLGALAAVGVLLAVELSGDHNGTHASPPTVTSTSPPTNQKTTTTTPTTTRIAACNASLRGSLASDKITYALNNPISLTLIITNVGKTTCVVNDSDENIVLVVEDSEGKKVWASDFCALVSSTPKNIDIRPGDLYSHPFEWNQKTSSPECNPSRQVAAGSYLAIAEVSGFHLAQTYLTITNLDPIGGSSSGRGG